MAGRRIVSARARAALLAPVGLDLPPLGPGRAGDPGLFGPGSEVWRIGRERVLLAGGAAALLLQLAHPLVAAGVAEHSDFPAAAFGRLRSTLDATLRISFGDREQAEQASGRVRATHARVRGRLRGAVGGYSAGTPYDAADQGLALWVHATLVLTALEAYATFVRPLDRDARSRYYEEATRFAALFGAPRSVQPPTYEAFTAYVEEMVSEGALVVGAEAVMLARDILDPPVPALVAPVRPLNRVITAGLLPESVRVAFDLAWGRPERSAFEAAAFGSRAAIALVPSAVRYWAHYRAAVRRCARRAGDHG
jgi:uncharacterized protein (DUF2236 family)